MKSYIRTLGYLILILTSIFFIYDTPFSYASESWVLSEVQISGGNYWTTFWTHDNPNVNGTSSAGSLIDIENGKFEVRVSMELYGEIKKVAMESEFDKPPDILIPGETIELDFTWSQVAGQDAFSYFCSNFQFGNHDKFNHHYEYADNNHPQNKLVITIPQVTLDEEFTVYLANDGPHTTFNGIKWVYRPAKTPIIFIPGVAGSELHGPNGELWPRAYRAGRKNLALDTDGLSNYKVTAPDIIRSVGHTDIYGIFIETVESWGYKEDVGLYLFPYDWRKNNYDHVEELDHKIDEVLKKTGQKKVVIIAHSMGGIVARAYMEKKGTSRIDRFITMGTPHLGAVKPYYAFLSGYNFGNPLVGNSIMKVIIQNCPSAYQLLPWREFISGPEGKWSLEESYGINYHSTYLESITELVYLDDNDWEWSLNPSMIDNATDFRKTLGTSAPKNIETYTIIGQGEATLESYSAREPTLWESYRYTGIKKADGSRWVLEPDPKKNFGDGDGTVPIWSASGLRNDKKFYVQTFQGDSAEHGALPANKMVQGLIKDILDGEEVREDGYPKVEYTDLSSTGFEIHSSANLHIYDSMSNHLGLNENGTIEESIPGGSMIAMDGYEYCSILGSTDSYEVEVVGFEEGNFTLDMVVRSNGKIFEFSYPEIEVVNGSVASLSLPDYESAAKDPPEIRVQDQDTVLSFDPKVVEVQIPVEENTNNKGDSVFDRIRGIPSFPIWSIGISLVFFTYIM